MHTPLNIIIGIVLTALPFGFLAARLFHDRRLSIIAVLGASVSATIWAIGYGIYDWQHRLDWEHIRNYPLWTHVVLMTISAVLYAALAFPVALSGAALLRKRPT